MVEALDNMKEWVMMLVMVVLIIGALALVLDGFQSDLIDDIVNTAVANETMTLNNVTAQGLSNNYVGGITQFLVDNGTDNVTLTTAEYTFTNTGGQIAPTVLLTNASRQGNASWVSYNYQDEFGTVQTNSTGQGLMGIANASSFFDTIGTLVGVGALVAVVMIAFYFARR